MTNADVRVIAPGMYTTLQDLGRYGYRHLGISVTGALDWVSTRIANGLLGNDPGCPVLEMTIMGPALAFGCTQVIAICGADLSPQINGAAVPLWTAVKVSANDVLTFGGCKSGARAYLAVSGGFVTQAVLNSCSTHVKGGFGGHLGRPLQKDDLLVVRAGDDAALRYVGNAVCPKAYQRQEGVQTLRATSGPQAGYFSESQVLQFYQSFYQVSGLCDRMGIRLSGEAIVSAQGADILSEPHPIGSIQMPGDGQPIILMNDAGTTGGYAKIGTIVERDLAKAAQLKPGDSVRFEWMTLAAARRLHREEHTRLNQVIEGLMAYQKPEKTYNVYVNGRPYCVTLSEIKE